jgi:hypothetical protein
MTNIQRSHANQSYHCRLKVMMHEDRVIEQKMVNISLTARWSCAQGAGSDGQEPVQKRSPGRRRRPTEHDCRAPSAEYRRSFLGRPGRILSKPCRLCQARVSHRKKSTQSRPPLTTHNPPPHHHTHQPEFLTKQRWPPRRTPSRMAFRTSLRSR